MINKEEILKDVYKLFSKYEDVYPLFICVSGSHMYGLNTEKSDIDARGVFICGHDRLLSEINFNSNDKYIKQINDDNNDFTFYEISRFLDLVESNNPNILELLNVPDEFILYKHPVFESVLKYKNEFITKKCGNAFNGYASTQIAKARGQNKMITNEEQFVSEKDLLDFCYAVDKHKTISLKEWLEINKYEQIFCGLSKVNHGNIQKKNKEDSNIDGGLYALYYDHISHCCFSKYETEENKKHNKNIRLENNQPLGYGFKGIVNNDDVNGTKEIRVSNIPKEIVDDFYKLNIIFNSNGYHTYLKDYKKYNNWVENRNPDRYKENTDSGYKGFDHKNASHCMRLLTMAEEILDGKGINVYRKDDREYLLSIRNGDVDYDSLLDIAEKKMKLIDELYLKCVLPEKVDKELLNNLLKEVRSKFYKL